MPHALIIDDDADFVASLAELVQRQGFTVATAGELEGARRQIASQRPSLVLVDLSLPDGTGTDIFKDLEDGGEPADIVIVSGHGTIGSAIDALRLGALDYLTKPLDVPRLKTMLASIVRARGLREEVGNLRNELRRLGRFGRLIGASPEMQKVYDLIAKVAPTSASVFITGESGTGKELVAETLHELSPRKRNLFLPLNCGAVPPTLIESELFGHERGSFTGATQLRKGHFEQASGGTLLLDEITEMPIELQVKLLRVLETGAVMRVGGNEPIAVDLRVIAATNRPPEEAVRAGKLRQDVFYRLNVFPIHIPPLRERQGDVLVLAEYFLDQLNRSEGTLKRFSPAARASVVAHSWPGNVRELKNEIQRAFIMSDEVVEFSGLSAPDALPPAPGAAANDSGPSQSFRIGTPLSEVERRLILATLEYCSGDKRKAAAMLGISLKTLYNRLNLYAAA